jgi:hypothetical protein
MHGTTAGGPKGRVPRKAARSASQAGAGRIAASREPRERPREYVHKPRRVTRLSIPATGIALPTQREMSRCRMSADSPAVSASSAASGRQTRPPTGAHGHSPLTNTVELQAQLAALGIELANDTIRERVRIAEERLASQTLTVCLGSSISSGQALSDGRVRSSVASSRSPKSAPRVFQGSGRCMRKRPSTARARLEHGTASHMAEQAPTRIRADRAELSPASGDEDVELGIMDDQDASASRCLPDEVLRSECDASSERTEPKLLSTHTGVDMLNGDTVMGNGISRADEYDQDLSNTLDKGHEFVETNTLCSLQTKKEWDTGSIWEWGNPNILGSRNISESEQESIPSGPVPRLRLSPRCHAPSSLKAGISRSAHLSLYPSSGSASARPFGSASRSKSAVVGLSPRTNVREPMGIWACPNTPGPGAYQVAERTIQGGNLYAEVNGKKVYGRSNKFGNEPRLAPTPKEVSVFSRIFNVITVTCK